MKHFNKLISLVLTITTVLSICLIFSGMSVMSSAAGNSIATADAINFDTVYSDSITESAREDYYSVILDTSGNLCIDFTSYMQYYCICIYDEDGYQVWYTDENEWISTTGMRKDSYTITLEAGKYYIKVNGYYYSTYYESTGNYNFKLTFQKSGANVAEPNNNIAQAKSISFDKTVKGAIAWNDAEDYYKINLKESGRITVKFTSYMKYYCMVIYDEEGYQVWYTDENEYVSTTGKRTDTYKIDLEQGKYYIKVNGYYYNTYNASRGFYNFKISFSASEANIAEPNNSILEAKKIKFGSAVKGQIAENDREDYYKITMSSAGEISIAITSYMKYYCVIIYNADGYQTWYTDENEWVSTSGKRSDTYTVNLEKGTYYIKVNGYYYGTSYASTGNYTFTVKRIIHVPSPGLKASSTTDSIKLSWSKVSGAAGYIVYQYNAKTKKYTKLGSVDKSKNTYTVKKLSAGKKYTYAVRAYKKVDGITYYSAYSKLEVATKTAAPKITGTTAGSKKATVKWGKVSGATGYQVYMATIKNGKFKKIATTSKLTYTKTGLSKGKTYYFKVRTYISAGGTKYYSSFSSVKSVKAK